MQRKSQWIARCFNYCVWSGFLVSALLAVNQSITSNWKQFATFMLSGMTRQSKIIQISMLITLGFVASVIFLYVRGMFWEQPWPLNSFLPAPINHFCDYFSIVDAWRRLQFNGGGNYFPAADLFIHPFSLIQSQYTGANLFIWISSSFMFIYSFINLKSQNLAATIQHAVIFSFMTYPVLFALHTANFEFFVFIFLCLFIHFYQQNNRLSTFFLALAISMKLVPGIFLVLLLADKKYKEIGLTFFWVIVLTLIPLLIFDGGLRSGLNNYLEHMKAGQAFYYNFMVLGVPGIHYGHSLINAARILMGPHLPSVEFLIQPYTFFVVLVLAWITYCIVFKIKDLWKKVAILIIAMNLLPYTSTDYKLLHLYIPLYLFINHSQKQRWDGLFSVLFAMLLIPKYYLYFYKDPLLSMNNVVNTFAMLFMGLLIILSKTKSRNIKCAQ